MKNRRAYKPKTRYRIPCGACKINKKKCSEKCVLAPYFPLYDPHKFLLVHRVFGNGNIIKLLQDLPAEQRGDAVSSMVYEASARLRDPVHSCVGVINDIQRKVAELQSLLDSTKADLESQLASTKAELTDISQQHANLLAFVRRSPSPKEREGTQSCGNHSARKQ